MRMLFAWLVIWPNDELPNAELAGAAHCTMLNMLSTSRRTDAAVRAAGPDVLADRQVDVVAPRRIDARQHARRVAELVERRRRRTPPC